MAPPPVPRRSLAVRVPASTSNLGPGFDLLGLALSLFLEVEVGEGGGEAPSFGELEGHARDWPTGADNLVLVAFGRGIETCGGDAPTGLTFRARSEIPLGRGLGSSGAAIAAGLALARAWWGPAAGPPNGSDGSTLTGALLTLGHELEGHPDNSTASLLGGCTLALPAGRGLEVVQHPIHPSIALAVAWPARTLATSAARRVLPRTVPFEDAVENPRRLAMLLEGLRTADPRLLALGEVDHLHVRHRLPLIPGGPQALDAAHDAGAWLATVSGSGSALVALGPRSGMEGVARAMAAQLGAPEGPAESRVVEPVIGPPPVVRGTLEDLPRAAG